MVHLWAALALSALTVAAVDPDSGIVIDWANLDKIVDSFDPSPPDAWLPPVQENCTMNGVSPLNAGGLDHEVYRPLFCPWFLKTFRDVFDMAVTETAKWPVYRKLMGASNVSTGLPVSGFFGACVCGVYENATRALAALRLRRLLVQPFGARALRRRGPRGPAVQDGPDAGPVRGVAQERHLRRRGDAPLVM